MFAWEKGGGGGGEREREGWGVKYCRAEGERRVRGKGNGRKGQQRGRGETEGDTEWTGGKAGREGGGSCSVHALAVSARVCRETSQGADGESDDRRDEG